jgi:hypothetical protein
VDGVQPALWKVREKDFSSFRGYADTKDPERWEERGIWANGTETLGQV